MANTVTLLSYANTFGDWVVTTNKLAQENNDLAANNYVKPTGTLFLNSPTLGLQVANNAVIQGQLQVSGIGSSAYVQKNLQVDGQIIGASNNYFIANDANSIFTITQSGSGLAIRINSQLGGSGTFGANSTVIDANGNVYIGSASAGIFKLNVANGNVNFANNLTVGSNVTAQIVRTTNHVVSKDVTASANILGERIQANTNLITPTLAVSGTAYIYYVQANNAVNTESLTVTNSALVGNLNANNYLSAANYIWAPVIVGSSNLISNNITANISFTTASLNVSTAINAQGVINAQSADLYIDDIVANTASIQGNFVINGDLIFNTDSLTLNSNTAVPQNGTFISARGPGNANAEIRWNESQDYWDIRDINNPSSYSKILTANLISDSLTSTSSDTFASSKAANNLNNLILSAYSLANNAGSSGNVLALQVQMTTANANIASLNTFTTAAYGKANAEGTINNTQNNWIAWANTFAQSAFSSANAGVTLATAAYGKANAEGTINNTQNTWITNTDTLATAAYGKANAEGSINNTQNTNITSVNTFAAASFNSANAGVTLATAAFARANTGVTSVSGSSPVSSSGGLTPSISLASAYGDTQNPYGSKTANFFLAAPNGSPGAPTFRAIVAADIPTLNQNTTGTASNITAYTINQNLGTGNNVQHNSLGIGAAATGVAGEIVATDNITAYYSDERLKNKLGNIENALDKVLQLNGFYYEANEIAQKLGYNVKKEVGVSAQEVEKVLPEIIAPAPIDNKYMTVRYEKLIPLLIEAIKELKTEIDSLKGDNK